MKKKMIRNSDNWVCKCCQNMITQNIVLATLLCMRKFRCKVIVRDDLPLSFVFPDGENAKNTSLLIAEDNSCVFFSEFAQALITLASQIPQGTLKELEIQ